MTPPQMTRYFTLGILTGMIAVPSLLLLASGSLRSVRPVTGLWASGIIEKKSASARAIARPKILLLGGSSVHYGYSAQQLEKITGWPAVNLGTQVGLGLHYVLNYCQKVVNTGDVIVLAFEFPQYKEHGKNQFPRVPLIVQAVYYDRQYYDSLPLLTRARFLSSLNAFEWIEVFRSKRNPNYAQSRAHAFFQGKRNRDPRTTNDYGDETQNTNRVFWGSKRASPAVSKGWTVEPAAVVALRDFSAQVSAKGATIALVFPTICSSAIDPVQHESNCGALRDLAQSLKIRILSKPPDTIFEPAEMYDGVDHPNAQGKYRLTGVLGTNLLKSGLLRINEGTR